MIKEIISKVLPQQYTVEQIHAEIDSAQDRILKDIDNMLGELNIPTEDKLKSKADKLKALGFVNSQPVKQYSAFEKQQKEVKMLFELNKTTAKFIRELSMKYPMDKFITIDEMNRICDKYKLIYAPSKHYIKDIPEKNVNEMASRKPLSEEHAVGRTVQLKYTDRPALNAIVQGKSFSRQDLVNMRVTPWYIKHYFDEMDGNLVFGIGDMLAEYYHLPPLKDREYNLGTATFTEQQGIFIAAPKSHFELGDLKQQGKFGFFKTIEVKDPIAFEHCQHDIVRIVSKWGTDDDQSYLDEALVNPVNN